MSIECGFSQRHLISKNISNSLTHNNNDSSLLYFYFEFLKLDDISWSVIGNFEMILESFLNNKSYEILYFLYEKKHIL